MHPEWIHVSSGYAGYMLEYVKVVRKRFPNHGEVILSGEREFLQPIDRRVRDFVCPACTEGYQAYWSNARK
jgi:hypothetical protein